MTRHGWSISLFQAKQQWSRMSSQDLKILLDSQLPRIHCQTFSAGLSPGHLGGNAIRPWALAERVLR
jgi:hypothetical protein